MNRNPHHSDETWENDPVWKLLDQAPPASASPRFADDTVRAARLLGQPLPWWRRIVAPVPLSGLTAAAAAVVFAWVSLVSPTPDAVVPAKQTAQTDFTAIQEIAETEILISAADQLDDLSDVELVSLIGF